MSDKVHPELENLVSFDGKYEYVVARFPEGISAEDAEQFIHDQRQKGWVCIAKGSEVYLEHVPARPRLRSVIFHRLKA